MYSHLPLSTLSFHTLALLSPFAGHRLRVDFDVSRPDGVFQEAYLRRIPMLILWSDGRGNVARSLKRIVIIEAG